MLTEIFFVLELEYYPQLKNAETLSSDILDFWRTNEKQFPHLSRVAKQVLCMCAVSVTSERLFLLSSHICSKCRAIMKPEMVAKLTTIAFNAKL